MEGIAAGLGDGIEKACGCTAKAGIVRRDGYLEFLDGVLAKGVGDFFAAAGVAEVGAGGVGAVEGEGVGAVAVGVAGVFAALFAADRDEAGLAVG